MSNSREALLSKFGRPTAGEARRRDYKGSRGRLNLRLSRDVLRGLAILKLGRGIDKNSFCQNALDQKVREAVEALRAELGPEGWQAVLRFVDDHD